MPVRDGTVRLRDSVTGIHTWALTAHSGGVQTVVFSPDGGRLAGTSGHAWDKTIRLWDATTGDHTRTFTGHTGRVNSVAFSPDGNTLASCSQDGTILLWDVSGE